MVVWLSMKNMWCHRMAIQNGKMTRFMGFFSVRERKKEKKGSFFKIFDDLHFMVNITHELQKIKRSTKLFA